MSMTFSDMQLLASGILTAFTGVALLKSPTQLLEFISPATNALEYQFGYLKLPHRSGFVDDPLLALTGVSQLLIGFFMIMGAYTRDEKFKRNSVSGRFFFAAACLYVCNKTPNGTSLIALLGWLNFIPAIIMGFTVGFGDGNAVDLEEAEKKAELEREIAKTS